MLLYEEMLARSVPRWLDDSNKNKNNNKNNKNPHPPKSGSSAAAMPRVPTHSSPATALRTALASADVPAVEEALYDGIPVFKITSSSNGGSGSRSGGGAMKPRVVTLSRDHMALFITHHHPHQQSSAAASTTTAAAAAITTKFPFPYWTPSKGLIWTNDVVGMRERYVRVLDIADIDAIVVGAVASTVMEGYYYYFKHNKNHNNNNNNSSSMVTIFHHDMEESLNLWIENATQRQNLVSTLQRLQATYRAATPWMNNTALLLRYLWYHVDVDTNGMISISIIGSGSGSGSEFQKICHVINLQLSEKQFQTYFDEFLVVQKEEEEEEGKGGATSTTTSSSPLKKNKGELTYPECMQLLHHIQTRLLSSTSPQGGGGGGDGMGALWERLFSTSTTTTKTATATSTITAQVLWKQFLQETQHEYHTTMEDAQRLLQCMPRFDLDADWNSSTSTSTTTPSPSSTTPISIARAQWEEYLLSEFNSAYDPAVLQLPKKDNNNKNEEEEDGYWSRPISEYWINTSHNTYLLGDQLQSKSSVQAYYLALERGCKCLELDCWDGDDNKNKKKKYGDADGNDGDAHNAVVFHGHTLTSKILCVDILKVVQAYLLQYPSTLPIILSLENHCSHPFQRSMAAQLVQIFGDSLYRPPLPTTPPTPLPSPEQLRGKVVIKGKRPPEPDDTTTATTAATPTSMEPAATEGEDDDDPYDEALLQQQQQQQQAKSDKKKDKKEASSSHDKIVPELAALTLFHGTKFKDFDKSIASDPSHMHSIGETKITKILSSSSSSKGGGGADKAKSWREYNQQHMTRTYPAGFRIDSSNYNPIVAWAMGCQLVALNFQTHDTPLLLNDGRFRQAGNCGYVRKPPSVMGRGSSVSTTITTTTTTTPKTVRIQILSGHCLPKPKGVKAGEVIDPYVKIELHDVRTTIVDDDDGGDENHGSNNNNKISKEEYCFDEGKTSVVKNNGFCPSWINDEKAKVVFHVQQPDVAMVLFQVLDEDLGLDDKIASAAIPVNALREGYRSVQLFSGHKSNKRSGPFEYATLFVRIDFL